MFITLKAITKLDLGHTDKFEKYILKKIAVMIHVLLTKQGLIISRCNSKKCTNNYKARAELWFCSFNLLFSDVAVAVAVVVFSNSLFITQLHFTTYIKRAL